MNPDVIKQCSEIVSKFIDDQFKDQQVADIGQDCDKLNFIKASDINVRKICEEVGDKFLQQNVKNQMVKKTLIIGAIKTDAIITV